jgi:hypothetical protein
MSRLGASILGVLALLFLPACANPGVPAFVAPGYSERQFESVCVLANFSDLQTRGTLEELVETGLRGRRGRVVRCSSLLFPDRDYSQEETFDAVRAEGIDALLILDPTESGEYRWIPLRIDDMTRSRSHVGGGVESEELSKRSISITAGRTTWHKVRVRILDLSNGRAVWLMEDTLRDFKLGSMENHAENIVDGLRETRILGR